jgi:8-oxo-dGTP diphosphatase
MNNIIVVTAAIIEKDDKFLITQRKKDSHNSLRWEFPGGKVEFGEDPKICLEREIDEELKINISAGDIIDYSSFVYDGKKHILLLGLKCKFISGEIIKEEIADYAWVSPDEMSEYDITEADIPFVKKLQKQASLQKNI